MTHVPYARLASLWREERAAQLVEFAVALPLLMIFVVGIFDFSSALTLKLKLTNLARDAARSAAADPASDLQSPSTTVPASVMDAFHLIDNYFLDSNLNDCGITAGGSPTNLTWTFTATGNGCPSGGLKIIINRGYFFPLSGAAVASASCTSQGTGSPTVFTPVATCVSIQYGYPWRFGRVASILGRSDTLPSQIAAVGVALNEN